ncbi:MAG TPA: NAD regulator, partial [Methyloceanibacter sp.]|nr:NAD regulator [Methyloceanibacter sp.]
MAEARRKAPQLAAATESTDPKIELGLNAAIVTVREQQPYILVVQPGTAGSGAWDALPFGTFAPRAHRTLEIGLREWVKRQTGLELGYVEQLYTFGDRGRHAEPGGAHTLSVGYLALTRGAGEELMGSHWSPWYAYFPWEDWREGKPDILCDEIEPRLKEWAERPPLPDEPVRALRRAERLRICFGIDGAWDEEKVLERYELLYEAGLVAEALRDGRPAAEQWSNLPELGRPMEFDHRRILATALGRLRGKLKYRPVVFELLPPEFTLYDLQQTVEAISGTLLHKQ